MGNLFQSRDQGFWSGSLDNDSNSSYGLLMWNELPEHCKAAETQGSFKLKLKLDIAELSSILHKDEALVLIGILKYVIMARP